MSVRAMFTSLATTLALSLIACAQATSPSSSPASAPSSPAPSPGAVAPVTLTYLGVAGWQVTEGEHALLVDPYFSRVRPKEEGAPVAPDEATIARYAPAHADGILVGHSHFDHVLDVPSIAKRTGAAVLGSESALNVARASGVSEQRLLLARGGETFALGPFSVRPVRALHGVWGGEKPGQIPRNVELPLTSAGYALGDVFQYLVRVAGRTVFIVGSPNFIESEIEGLRPDVAIVAGPSDKVPDYACRLMRALGKPPLVLANHFDNHAEPLGPKQMDVESERRADLAGFEREIHACAPQTKFVVPAHFRPISI
ncbi:MBL fold metallo-hydrolase [Pendulispora albinea]|uniref:MBL fold metallo-hydrolase n=1 Tax=Pendulispora albinea TaxID=2741071 RepID=A0ABZ2LKZ0_9BACT